ncbi:MAG: hydroxymyristoyl-ACP dehydratase [Bacteroidota bacterium]
MSKKATILANKSTIEHYIPQRPPIVMVDELVSLEETTTHTRFTPHAENFFCKEGLFRESGLIEHMAQSAAAGVGYWYKSQQKEVPLGYIGAVQKFKLEQLPPIATTLDTHIETMHQVLSTKVIKATTYLQGHTVASCEMKIFIDDKTINP